MKYKGSTLLAFKFTFITGGIFNPYIQTSKTQDWTAVNCTGVRTQTKEEGDQTQTAMQNERPKDK